MYGLLPDRERRIIVQSAGHQDLDILRQDIDIINYGIVAESHLTLDLITSAGVLNQGLPPKVS
jgi:hypothetical protein